MNQRAMGLALISVLLLSGCSTTRMSSGSMSLEGQIDSDIKADVEVGQRISGESSFATLFSVINIGGPTEFADGVTYGTASGGSAGLLGSVLGGGPVAKAKSAAAHDALTSSGADLIVSPQYSIQVKDYVVYKKLDVTVEGYKGTINSIE